MKGKKLEIAFFDAREYDKTFFNEANRLYGYHIRYYADKIDSEHVELAGGADAVCAFVNDTLSSEVLAALQSLGVKLLAMRCAGFNNVDLAAAEKAGIPVVRVPAYSPHAVAEYAVAMLLTLNRKTHRAYVRVRDNNFSINGLLGFDLHGKTVGVVGTGRIGRIFSEIMLGFGMRVLAFDPYPTSALQDAGVRYTTLEELYASSDVISLHCPLTHDSHHMICAETLAQMRRGVLIVNTSRGALVDAAALIEALKSGRVGGAALDVYEEEERYFFEDFSDRIVEDDYLARLAGFNQVLVTSHQGFFTREAMTGIASTTLGNIRAFENGETLLNRICPKCV